MAVDDRGERNRPIYQATGAPSDAEDAAEALLLERGLVEDLDGAVLGVRAGLIIRRRRSSPSAD
ncbi:hypothetical protein IAE22_28780 [Bacillus sp. S34]|nr:hypothetical protein [Bacillus sp. S34]